MSRGRVLVAVVCDHERAALLAGHPQYEVLFAMSAALGGTYGPTLVKAAPAGENRDVPATPLLHTTQDAADRFQLSERKVRQLISRGELAVVRIGGSVRITPAELESFVARLGSTTTEDSAT